MIAAGRVGVIAIPNGDPLLEQCYDRFAELVNCQVVDVDADLLVTRTPESRGFNPFDFQEAAYSRICKLIGSQLGLTGVIVESQSERIDRLFKVFSSVLEAGEIPSIYELHSEGLKHIARGDEKSARWCERQRPADGRSVPDHVRQRCRTAGRMTIRRDALIPAERAQTLNRKCSTSPSRTT